MIRIGEYSVCHARHQPLIRNHPLQPAAISDHTLVGRVFGIGFGDVRESIGHGTSVSDVLVSGFSFHPEKRTQPTRCAGSDAGILRPVCRKAMARKRRPISRQIPILSADDIKTFPRGRVETRKRAQTGRKPSLVEPEHGHSRNPLCPGTRRHHHP